MAFATMDFPSAEAKPRKSIWTRMFDALVEARMREAQRVVNGHLLSMDDQTLENLGYDRATLLKKPTAYRL